ncbi:helix-turn-helix domain-containing protein [Aurantimonas sp. HBX-1]|uniref:helix-turn-helix domain-containing protein n=1 Tax=Aurantimonas sp. HBX-1 TaxID=2906072 RepID=UPI001F2467DD|nr:helix-turn-helix domain-containing protein [Aurantimonas sp. HBX-1]UIJ72447.1 helix-turn-helix domain-containing protein [Aurantimonas sp. HBX-1]
MLRTFSADGERGDPGRAAGNRGPERRLGPLVLGAPHAQEGIEQRPAAHGSREAGEDFIIQLVLAGRLDVDTYGAIGRVGAGEIVLFDMRRPRRTEACEVLTVVFRIARDALEAAFPASHLLHGAVLRPPHAGLLAETMQVLCHHGSLIPEAQGERAARVFAEMLAITLHAAGWQPGRAVPAGDPAGLARARRLVEMRLASADLGPALLAAEIGVSRSRLYDLFKPLGGVSRYIQERRASRLHDLLCAPHETRSVAVLAYAAGFATESHASRTFRDVYGIAPGRFRRLRREAGDAPGALPSPDVMADGEALVPAEP